MSKKDENLIIDVQLPLINIPAAIVPKSTPAPRVHSGDCGTGAPVTMHMNKLKSRPEKTFRKVETFQ